MKRRFDDEDERPSWLGRLAMGVVAGALVSGIAAAAVSLFLLPPAPPPPPEAQSAGAESAGEPQIIDGIEVSTEPAYSGSPEATIDEAEETAGPLELAGPALVANAVPFEAEAGVPLVAVVLADAAANPLLHESLFALDVPVTIGVVAGAPGDEVTARTARDAGFEVVAELPMARPGTADGAMLEYGLPAELAADRTMLLMRRLPMTVAATRALDTPSRPDGGVLDGVTQALGPLGFAYVEHGLGPDGAPSVTSDGLDRIVGVSRLTIPAGASAAEAHAVLDRAAAEAAETGAAIVMAHAEQDVLIALQLWATEDGLARLAPLSAVIRRQNGGDAIPSEIALEDMLPDGGTAGDAPESPAN